MSAPADCARPEWTRDDADPEVKRAFRARRPNRARKPEGAGRASRREPGEQDRRPAVYAAITRGCRTAGWVATNTVPSAATRAGNTERPWEGSSSPRPSASA